MAEDITITRWLLDVRDLWPGEDLKNPSTAAVYLNAIPPAERQQQVLSKYHRQDACMSLGSALLKRAYIALCTGLPWHEIQLGRKLHERLGKPCWVPPAHDAAVVEQGGAAVAWPVIDFNVSHQRGIVVLVGVCQRPRSRADGSDVAHASAEIAVDVVSPNERNDMASIASTGLADFISTFADILSPQESFALTYSLAPGSSITLHSGEPLPVAQLGRLDRVTEPGRALELRLPDDTAAAPAVVVTFDSELIVDEKLRAFYACFSLKESFVKLGGEGLAAEWIQRCEFHNVRAPARAAVARCSLAGVFGELIANDTTGGFHVTLDDGDVTNVKAEIQAFEEDYLLSTMMRPKQLLVSNAFPPWQRVTLERDVLPFIHNQRHQTST